MINSFVNWAFDIMMWMLTDPAGQRAFIIVDASIIVFSISVLWLTRNSDT